MRPVQFFSGWNMTTSRGKYTANRFYNFSEMHDFKDLNVFI